MGRYVSKLHEDLDALTSAINGALGSYGFGRLFWTSGSRGWFGERRWRLQNQRHGIVFDFDTKEELMTKMGEFLDLGATSLTAMWDWLNDTFLRWS
jgi:hypothetical protein